MIVREIIKDPTLIDCFDWFNDYKDTRLFISERGDEALLEKFDTKYSEWCHQKSQTMSTPSSGSHNTHARLSPSSAKSWSNCTASISYIEANADRIPKDNSSAYSQEGTEAHDHAADVLLGKKTIDQIPEDFRPYVAAYVDHCLSLAPDGVVPQIESQVPLWYQADQNGTVDFAVVTEDRVTIRDLKYGAGVLVTAQENPQLAIYAYSLIRMLDPVYEFTPETVVDIGIFQPRHREADTSVPWIITLKELAEFCREIEYAVIQVQTGRGLKFAPSEGDDGACRWCKAKGICEARHAAISEALVVPDSGVTREEMVMSMPDLTKDEKKLPPLDRVAARLGKLGVPEGAITEKYLVGLFAAKKSMESLLDDVAEYLSARAMEGNIPEGTKLVLGRAGNRAWVNEEAADTFLKNQGLKQDERYDFKVKSPTAAEEILKDKLKSSKRTATRFAELVSRSEPKKTLALASDKREACLPDVAVMPDLVALDDFEV
jgi:hypothetical protein